jgi:hypothetical protein
MKKLFLPFSVFLLCGISFAGKGQYLGGNADGFAYKPLIVTVCPPQSNSNIYFGGNAEGAASSTFIASVCPAQSNSNIFFGGNADGSTSKSFIASICPPQLNSNVFFGGNADGFSSKSLIVTVCPPQPNSNVFYGGTADGFAYKPLIITVCPPQTNSNIYYGGNAAGSRLGQVITAVCAVLPIELLSFTGTCEKQKINLKWSTATDNNYFTIESSTDGISWITAGLVNGAGNSTSLRTYSFIDTTSTNKALIYYRLMQTDFNGEYKYWNIIAVEKCADNATDKISVYPNTSSGKFNLSFTGDKNLVYSTEIFNSVGEKIYASSVFQSKIDLSDKPSGVYYLHLNTVSKSLNTKVVIEK